MSRLPSSARLSVLVSLILTAVLMIFVVGRPAGRTTLDDRVRAVAVQLRCPVCQGESVWDAPSGQAASMRTVIRRQLRAGRSPDEVKQYFIDRYGQWILEAPPVNGIGALVWFGPIALFVLGAGLVGFAIRRWYAQRTLAPNVAPPDLTAGDNTVPPLSPRVRSQGWTYATALGVAALALAVIVVVSTHPSTTNANQTSSISPRQMHQLKLIYQASEQAKKQPTASNYLRLGKLLTQAEDFPEAAAAYKRALHIQPSAATRYVLAFAQIESRHFRQALTTIRPLTTASQSSAKYWLLEGLANANLKGRSALTVRDFRLSIRLDPKQPFAPLMRRWIANHSAAH
jgi:cytochrome c-type biogenesis protein CcmH